MFNKPLAIYSLVVTLRFFLLVVPQPLVGLFAIQASRSHSRPQSVGPVWASDQPDAETCTWQHTTFTTDRHPCPWRYSNPQSQQASGGRPTSWTARPMASAVTLCTTNFNTRFVRISINGHYFSIQHALTRCYNWDRALFTSWSNTMHLFILSSHT